MAAYYLVILPDRECIKAANIQQSIYDTFRMGFCHKGIVFILMYYLLSVCNGLVCLCG